MSGGLLAVHFLRLLSREKERKNGGRTSNLAKQEKGKFSYVKIIIELN
jgi:hypothetical protein